MAMISNLTIDQGASFKAEIDVKDADGDALDLTGSNRALKLAGTTILNSRNYMGNVARFYFQNNMTGTYIEAESSYLEINNSNGYTRIGAGNSSYSHFYTD